MAEKQNDLNLPANMVSKIMQHVLPRGCDIDREAKLAVARGASVFVLSTTANANMICQGRNKKTVSGEDILDALREANFGHFEAELRQALAEFKKGKSDKKKVDEPGCSKYQPSPSDELGDSDTSEGRIGAVEILLDDTYDDDDDDDDEDSL